METVHVTVTTGDGWIRAGGPISRTFGPVKGPILLYIRGTFLDGGYLDWTVALRDDLLVYIY